jgi:tetratricopeptide (TPR) repeat protein
MRRIPFTCGLFLALALPCLAQTQPTANNSSPEFPAIVASGDYLPPFSAGGEVRVFLLRNAISTKNLDIKALGDSLAKLAQQQYDRMRSEWGVPSPGKSSLNIVEIPNGGAITSSSPSLAKIASNPLRGGDSARLLVNTIAHQWWGLRVAPATRNDAWITNGMCRYAEFEYLQKTAKAEVFQDAIKNSSASALAYDSVPLSQSAQFSDGSVEWNALTYDKGAMIFRMLRWQIGEPAFEQTLRAVLSQPEKTISMPQLETLAEASAHQNLRPFFTQWVDGTGAPTLRNDWTLYRLGENKGYRVAGEIHEDLDLFTMPVEVRVVSAAKIIDQRVRIAGQQTPYQIDTAEIPKTITLDPDRWLLRNGPKMQVRVHLLRGQNKEAQNNLSGAIQEYKQALAINSVDSLASYRLGEVYMRQKNYQAAADAFRDALRGSGQPAWTIVWSNLELGKVFDAMGQRERAINQYREALQTQDNTGGALGQARVYLQHPYTASAPPAAQ